MYTKPANEMDDDPASYRIFDELRAQLVPRQGYQSDAGLAEKVRATLPQSQPLVGHDKKGGVETLTIKTDKNRLPTGSLTLIMRDMLTNYMLAQPQNPEAPALLIQQGDNVYRNEKALEHLGIHIGIEAKVADYTKKTKPKKVKPKPARKPTSSSS